MFDSSILAARPELLQRSLWELPRHFVPRISNSARKTDLKFGCTPFYLNAVDELKPYVDFLKIASYELLWDDLLVACGKTGIPVVLSTGMATLEEVDRAVQVLQGAGCKNLTLLHCVSAYPAPIEDTNLAAIQTLREHTGLPVGWSDHSNDPAVIYRAVHHWGASFVEMHFDLDGEGAEFEPGHCWLPETAAEVIRNVKSGFAADGHGRKEPAPSELADRAWRADPSDGLRPMLAERARWKDGPPDSL